MSLAQPTSARRALTLIEVLLVLALLVMLAAVVWPELEPVVASLELRKSAERIRVEWERARVDALSTGRTILFRYEPDSNHYCLQRCPEPQFTPGGTADQTTDSTSNGAEAPDREAFLPEKIHFDSSEISDNATDWLGDVTLPATSGEWSDPVVFYPDGTTSDAKLVLTNQRDQSVELSLRGLTGVVTLGDVIADAETGS